MVSRHRIATIIVSRQTIEDGIRIANDIAEQLMESEPNSPILDQVADAGDRLAAVLRKSPDQMKAEGASTLEDYFDDARMPEQAKAIKADVEVIRNARNQMRGMGGKQQPGAQTASANDFLTNRDDDGEPKRVETAEVPRVQITSSDEKKGSDMNKKAEETATAPAPEAAAPAAPAAPAPAAVGANPFSALTSESLTAILKALVGVKELENDKAAQGLVEQLASELKTRPVQVEQKAASADQWAPITAALTEAKVADPAKVANWLKSAGYSVARAAFVIRRKGAQFVVDKMASWTPQNQDTMKVEKGSLPEIAEAHAKVDDNTGITRPSTVLPDKFAAAVADLKEAALVVASVDAELGKKLAQLVASTKTAAEITTGAALKKAEDLGEKLAKLYLDAKVIASANGTRPVREAVESIYVASVKFGEAAKVLAKQVQAEEQEEEAQKVTDKKKSSLVKNLVLASEE